MSRPPEPETGAEDLTPPEALPPVAVTAGLALVLHPARRGRRDAARPVREPEDALEEAVGLARAIDLTIGHSEVVSLPATKAATLLGPGQVERLGQQIRALGPEVVIIDHLLTPTQHRNLETAWGVKVLDRTALILEIFGARARTREGRLQVALASLRFQRSRLVRSWTHLDRQRGATGFIGGPGETQLELDRRLIDDRILRLEQELEEVRRTRGLHRAARERVPYPVIVLVGYTNAGKSTLFNRLSGADVLAKDLLFATLDPTMRGLRLPGGEQVILSDTVGFVSDLPHELVAAFRATLEEVEEADLILHVRDIAHPDSAAQRADVLQVLAGLGIEEADPRLLEVWNKLDRIADAEEMAQIQLDAVEADAVALSALTGEGLERLRRAVSRRLDRSRVLVTLELPAESAGEPRAWLHRHGTVRQVREDAENARILVTVALDPGEWARFQARYGGQIRVLKS